MTHAPTPESTSGPTDAPDDRRDDPPPPTTLEGVEPASEAEREAAATIRSISRLEESN